MEDLDLVIPLPAAVISSAMALALKPYLCSSVFGSERAPENAERPDFKRLSSKNIRQAISKSRNPKSWQRRDYLDIPWRPVCRLVSRFDEPSGETGYGTGRRAGGAVAKINTRKNRARCRGDLQLR